MAACGLRTPAGRIHTPASVTTPARREFFTATKRTNLAKMSGASLRLPGLATQHSPL